MIDQDLILKLFSYDPETGVFKRIGRLKSNGLISKCDFVGVATSSHGYLQYTVKDKTYDVHRLIFMYINGEFPNCDVDHIDGNRRNNRLTNLRLVSRSENLKNVGIKTIPKSGHTGVGWNHKTNKWRVWIQNDHYDGFKSLEEAISFRKTEEASRNFSKDHFKRKVWDES